MTSTAFLQVPQSGQKFIKNAKNGHFLKTYSLWSNIITIQVSFNLTKIGGKCQNWKTQMRHFGGFDFVNLHKTQT